MTVTEEKESGFQKSEGRRQEAEGRRQKALATCELFDSVLVTGY